MPRVHFSPYNFLHSDEYYHEYSIMKDIRYKEAVNEAIKQFKTEH